MAHSHATLLRCYHPPLARFPRIVHDNGAAGFWCGERCDVSFGWDTWKHMVFLVKNGYLISASQKCFKPFPWVQKVLFKNNMWNQVLAQLQRMSGMYHDVSCMYTARWLPKRQCICSISYIVDASTHPDSICVFSKHTILFIFYSKTHISKMSLWKQSSVISIYITLWLL